MKRRLFLRSVWLQGMSLPAAYMLGPAAAAADSTDPLSGDSGDQDDTTALNGKGCGRTSEGSAKRKHGYIVRDFNDPYLELIRLLKEASEIEHALMIQYIFAAFSLKPKYQALVGTPAPASNGLLSIAIQEMQHLAVVNKLLVALGSSPNLQRQDFPYEPDIYPFPMSLERLSRQSLARYTYVEAGRDSIPTDGKLNASDQLMCDRLTAELGTNTGMNHVAGLYAIIVNHISEMAESGALQLQDFDAWLAQLNHIMVEGEKEHFRFFRQLFLSEHEALAGPSDPWDLPQDHPDYPSFDVAPNPSAYLGHENQIQSLDARGLAWLSNLHYWIVLMMLDYYYRNGTESMNALAQAHMVGPLQSLAGELADMGVGLPFDALSLGYSPAPDPAGNLRFLDKMSQEANTLAHKLKATLPAGYPLAIHRATDAVVQSELAALG